MPTATPTAATAGASSPTCAPPRARSAARSHAFEVFADVAPATTPRARRALRLARVGRPARRGASVRRCRCPTPPGCAPFWAQADPTVSSLQLERVRHRHRPPRRRPRPGGRRTPVADAGPPTTAWPPSTPSTTRRSRSSWPPRSGSSTPCTTSAPRPPPCSSASARTSPPTGWSRSRRAAEGETMRAARLRPLPRPARAGRSSARRPSTPTCGAWPTSSRTTAAGASTSRTTRRRPSSSGAAT